MSFRLANSIIPRPASSRPYPERVMAPNGSSGRAGAGWLMKTMPRSMRSATRRARSTSPQKTQPPSP
jgi:hypothetical protein